MKICIYGTGAVGGALGGVLANAEHEMTFIARGEHLKKMQDWGLTIITPEGRQTIWGHFTNLMTTVETPDYLFLCVKSYSIPEIEENVNRITGPDTVIIPVLNGIPWWHFHSLDGPLKDYIPECLDPKGNLAKYFPVDNVIGSVVYMTSTIVEPGIIENHKHPPKLMVGEITGQDTSRLNRLVGVLEKAGFKKTHCRDIRSEIWLKLCWNIAFNPISALTGMTAGEIVEDKNTRELAVKLMRELETIAEAAGVNLNLDIEDRMNIARKSGRHKPSMLQDLQQGKRLEIEAIVAAPLEIAGKLGINCPNIEKLHEELRIKQEEAALQSSAAGTTS